MFSDSDAPYLILAYYLFTTVEDPHAEVKAHRTFFAGRDITSRIYLSEQGINGQMCGARSDAEAYMSWIASHPLFSAIEFKVTPYCEQVFPRTVVKYRKQLVAIDVDVDLSQGGEYLTPRQWKERLDTEENRVVLDTRNDYEWRVGHFSGAEEPPCETFRDFDKYADALKERVDPATTPIMMYCTGGIRCEIYSALMKERGFKKVYQLKGGIIGYGNEVGSDHWKGKLFVFDDRLTVALSDEQQTPSIGKCRHCSGATDDYFNCANMDCNELFLCCSACLQQHSGCCCAACQGGARLRAISQQNPHKPFRKWYYYYNQKPTSASNSR